MSKEPKITIALSKLQWVAITIAAPFLLMVALKLSWEALYWWARVVFAEEVTQQALAFIAMGISWVALLMSVICAVIEGIVSLKVRS
jgi:hypothetical protein